MRQKAGNIPGIKEAPTRLDEMYQDYLMSLNHRYGYGRISNYECVELWERCPEVLQYKKKDRPIKLSDRVLL